MLDSIDERLSLSLAQTTHSHGRELSYCGVRLAGTKSTALQGRVEICHNGQYRLVCDDYWDLPDATVVCRMLGYERATNAYMQAHNVFGAPPNIGFWLDDLQCSGAEANLFNCPRNSLAVGHHNCAEQYESAGVVCAGCAARPGQYALGTACLDCPLGTFQDTAGQSACKQCAAGTYNDAVGQTACKQCPAGRFRSTEGATSLAQCVLCAAGRYGLTAGSESCPFVAPAGFFTPEGTSVDPEAFPSSFQCVPGRYGGVGETTPLCTGPCPAGRMCPAGTGNATVVGNPCGPLGAGAANFFCPLGTASTAMVVQAGFFSTPEMAAVNEREAESPCPIGYYCASGLRYACPAGRFGNRERLTSASCSGACEAGYYCPGSSPLSPAPGPQTAVSTSPRQEACGVLVDPLTGQATALAEWYCPLGTSARLRAPSGFYTTPESAPAGLRTGVAACPAEFVCAGGERRPKLEWADSVCRAEGTRAWVGVSGVRYSASNGFQFQVARSALASGPVTIQLVAQRATGPGCTSSSTGVFAMGSSSMPSGSTTVRAALTTLSPLDARSCAAFSLDLRASLVEGATTVHSSVCTVSVSVKSVAGWAASIGGGELHTCVSSADGEVWCWGSGLQGQLGYGSTASLGDDESPFSAGPVSTGGVVRQLAVGFQHTCVLLTGGAVRCWGLGQSGRLGYGNVNNIGDNELPSSVNPVSLNGEATQIGAGMAHTCALLAGGFVRCWGRNNYGQLGLGHTRTIGDDELPSSVPTVQLGTTVTATFVQVFEEHVCVITANRRLMCWGWGQHGRLGYGSGNDGSNIGDNELPSSAGFVGVGADVVHVSGQGSATCALFASGNVRCWGFGGFAQLGQANTGNLGVNEQPASIPWIRVGGSVVQLSAGGRFACVILSGAQSRCWGLNTNGQLGIGSTVNIGDDEYPDAAPLLELPDAPVQVAAFYYHACALLQGGGIACWGKNSNGQLGVNFERRDSGDVWRPAALPTLRLNPGQPCTSNSTCTCRGGRCCETSDSRCVACGESGVCVMCAAPWTLSASTGLCDQMLAPSPSPSPSPVVCVAGSYRVGTSRECAACPAGRFSATSGATSVGDCQVCPAGTFSEPGAMVCDSCATGRFSLPGSSGCEVCPAGTYGDLIGETVGCVACPAGTASEALGATSAWTCRSCQAGSFSVGGVARCEWCSAGTFSSAVAAQNASVCEPCGAGTFSTQTGATDRSACVSCPAGTASAALGASAALECEPCPAGTYSESGSQVCEPCPAGTFHDRTGATSVGVCERRVITSITVIPPTLRQSGGNQVFLEGRFLARAGENVSLSLGPYVCAQPVASADGHRLSCLSSPAGAGGPHAVAVDFGDGSRAVGARTVSFEPALVDSISPSSVQPNSSVFLVVAISGDRFGWTEEDVTRVTIGGNECEEIVRNSSTLLTCMRVQGGGFSSRDVIVYLGDVVSVGGSRRLEYPSPPTVFGAEPSVVPAAGNVVVQLLGTSFGLSASLIQSVHLGPYECSSVIWVSPNEMSCTAPAGVGGPYTVTVETTDGLRGVSPFSIFRYEAPEVARVVPDELVSNPSVAYDIGVYGLHFGSGADDVEFVAVGGQACAPFVWVNDTYLECRNVSAPWSEPVVEVRVGGQTTRTEQLFRFQPAPVVRSVIPATGPTGGGTRVRVLGAGFGTSVADVESVWVGAGPCGNVSFHSSSELSCDTPAGVGRDLAVVVVTLQNGESEEGVPLFSYAAPRVQSVVAPVRVFAGEDTVELVLSVQDVGATVGSVSVTVEVAAGVVVPCGGLTGETGGGPASEIDSLRCGPVSFVAASQAGGEASVWVSVGGQTARGSIPVVGRARVDALVPASSSPVAGGEVVVWGESFGFQAEDVVEVRVGPYVASNVSWVSSSQLVMVVPVGVGRNHPVVVTTRGGLSSLPSALFHYPAPAVEAVEPGYGFARSGVAEFVLTGRHFGNQPADLRAVFVGAEECSAVLWVSSEEVRCEAVNSTSWTGSAVSVRVVVGDQEGVQSRAVAIVGRPRVDAVVPDHGPTMSETVVTVVGSNFGFDAADVLDVRVGDQLALNVTFESSTRLRVVVPPGVGSSNAVVVTTRGGQASEAGGSGARFRYDAAEVSSLTPSYAFANAGAVVFAVRGSNFGNGPADLVAMTIGGEPCLSLTWVSPWALECEHELPSNWTARQDSGEVVATSEGGGLAVVRLQVGDQEVRARVSVAIVGRPRVDALSPSSAPTSPESPVWMTVVGSNFGFDAADVLDVRVGDQLALNVTFESSTRLRVVVPPGVGSSNAVVVTTRGGQASEAGGSGARFRYDAAEVSSLTPSYAFVTPGAGGNASFVLQGSNFGNGPADVRAVRIGGVPCGSVAWLAVGRIRCESVPQDQWTANGTSVAVDVGGQWSETRNVFEAIERPQVASVFPSVAAEGETIVITGSGFGYASADVHAVTVGSEPCTPVTFVNPTTLSCPMPARNPSAPLRLPVYVTTPAGTSRPSVRLSYLGFAFRPVWSPNVTVVERTTTSLLSLSWSYPLNETDDVEEPQSYDVALEDLQDPPREQLVSMTPDRLAALRSGDGLTSVLRGTVLSFTEYPVRIRVRAVNDAGAGPWSPYSAPIAEVCESTEFLTTHQNVSLWKCASCPAGGVCFGTGAETVLPLQGYWRVPWSPAGLGFAACPNPDACQGVDPTVEGFEAPTNSTSVVFIGACQEGYTGVLCSVCDAEHYRTVGGTCQPCGTATDVRNRVFALLLLAVVVLSVLLVRTHMIAGTPHSSRLVCVLKVVFNHFQSIAIVSAIQFTWPQSVDRLFEVTNTMTVFSTEGVSLECATGEAGRTPYARTLIVYTIVLWFFLFAALLWAIDVRWGVVAFGTRVYERLTCQKRSPVAVTTLVTDPLDIIHRATDTDYTRWLRRLQISAPVLLFLLHTGITKAAFGTVACEDVASLDDPNVAEPRLSIDLNYRCDDPANRAWMYLLALPVLLLFSFGIPLAAFYHLLRYPALLRQPTLKTILGFLLLGFREDFEGWEAVNTFRKVMLAAVVILVRPAGPFNQVGAGLLIISSFGFLHAWYKPYATPGLNRLEMTSLVVLAATMLSGLFVQASNPVAVTDNLCPAIIFIANLAFLALVLAEIIARTQKKTTDSAAKPNADKSAKPNGPPQVVDNPLRRLQRTGSSGSAERATGEGSGGGGGEGAGERSPSARKLQAAVRVIGLVNPPARSPSGRMAAAGTRV